MRVPWRLKNASRVIRNFFHYGLNKACNAFSRSRRKPQIIFVCKQFRGVTGSTVAFCRIANLLADRYAVDFVSKPCQAENTLLRRSVRIIGDDKPTHGEIYITAGDVDMSYVRELHDSGKIVIPSMHAILTKDNDLRRLYTASKAHLVGEVQLMHHTIDKERYFVIPNCCPRIRKTRTTSNAGIVGRVDDPKKNVSASLDIARSSNASEIHLWGGPESKKIDKNVYVHEWSFSLEKVYGSFDVLISMSREESFGLTVIEALSAGIPCVLSDIPAFRAFGNCPGVTLVSLNDPMSGVRAVNEYLTRTFDLTTAIRDFWEQHYSEAAVGELWFSRIEPLLKAKRPL